MSSTDSGKDNSDQLGGLTTGGSEQLTELVKELSDLIGEKGVGAITAAIGGGLIILVVAGQFFVVSLDTTEVIVGIVCGTILMIIGSSIRIYSSKVTMQSALEEKRLQNEERIEYWRIQAQKEIANFQLHSEERTRSIQTGLDRAD